MNCELFTFLFRVDAIRGAEEERQSHLASRANPLDSELIKTKGLLRAPSLRNRKAERKKRLEKEEGGSSDHTLSTASSSSLRDVEVKEADAQVSKKSYEHRSQAASPDVASNRPSPVPDGQSLKRSNSSANTFDGHAENCTSVTLSKESNAISIRDKETLSKPATKELNPVTPPVSCNQLGSKVTEKRPRRSREGIQGKDNKLSGEIDNEARRNLLKDVENYRKESVNSTKKVARNGD